MDGHPILTSKITEKVDINYKRILVRKERSKMMPIISEAELYRSIISGIAPWVIIFIFMSIDRSYEINIKITTLCWISPSA